MRLKKISVVLATVLITVFMLSEVFCTAASLPDDIVQNSSVSVYSNIEDEKNDDCSLSADAGLTASLFSRITDNGDGTKTLEYFSYPVRYIDNSGEIRDISLELTADEKGFVPKEHTVFAEFPEKIEDGIMLAASGYGITMTPTDSIGANLEADSAILKDSTTVSYRQNDIVSYEYSLTYAGYKENIVVTEYTGQDEFFFRLKTDGLVLTEISCSGTEDSSLSLADSEGNIIATIGDIIVFSADSKNNTNGFISYETLEYGQEYVLKISIPDTYLSDSQTEYPIYIDPTIEISYNGNGAGAIQDISVCSQITYPGNTTYLFAGKNSEGAVHRCFFRFPYLDIAGKNVIYAGLCIRDLMCEGQQIPVECHEYTGPYWNESSGLSWAASSCGIGQLLDTRTIYYGNGNVSGESHWYSFDITALARKWAGYYESPGKGVLLKSAEEYENGNVSGYKTIASYNRANYKPYVTITYYDLFGGNDFDDARDIEADEYGTVIIDEEYEEKYFSFTPEETGTYYVRFNPQRALSDTMISAEMDLGTSYGFINSSGYEVKYYRIISDEDTEVLLFSSEETEDPCVWIYDSSLSLIASDDDIGGYNNFRVSFGISEQQIYYVVVGNYDNLTGSCKLNTLKDADVTTDVYYIKNLGTGYYMATEELDNETYVNQTELAGVSAEKWTFEKNGDGYYTIKSEYGTGKYIGISGTGTGVDNIQMCNSITDACRWKIYITGSGGILFEPKMSPGKVMYAPDNLEGSELQLTLICNFDTSTNRKAVFYVTQGYGTREFITLSDEENGNYNCLQYALQCISNEFLNYVNNLVNPFCEEYVQVATTALLTDNYDEITYYLDIFTEEIASAAIHLISEYDYFSCIYEDSFSGNGENRPLDLNQYRIVLRTGYHLLDMSDGSYEMDADYHFWYQTKDGTWANKHGTGGNPEHLNCGITPYSSGTSGWSYGGYVDYYCSSVFCLIITINE